MLLQRRRQFLAMTAAAPLVLAVRPAFAATPRIYAEDGAPAIDGSDTVAYFDGNGPVAGDPNITHDWNGATWRFASEENRDLFAADPGSYAPQYGGYCAYAMADDRIASTVPEAWTLEDGRLYLNFSLEVQDKWRKDIPGYVAAADANWPGILEA